MQRARRITTPLISTLALVATLHASPAAAGSDKVLYSFTNGTDGAVPYAGLVRDAKGNLYGSTQTGGAGSNSTDTHTGTIFVLSPKNVLTTLHAFTGGADGDIPQGTLAADGHGNFYGSTEATDNMAGGTIFRVSSTGAYTVLQQMSCTGDTGCGVSAGLTKVGSEFYGAASFGGKNGAGTIFRIDAAGKFHTVYAFSNGEDGGYPFGSLVGDGNGNLYGTTPTGGANGDGTIFKVTTTGTETVLYSFAGGDDGSNPFAGLARDSQGNLYGTTEQGGTYNNGTVFELPAGGTEKVIYTFLGGNDGANPYSQLVINGAGQLVGTTAGGGLQDAGTVFAVTLSTGLETQIYSFAGGADGSTPYAGVLLTKEGKYFGTTSVGGANGAGTVFEIIP